MTDTAEVAMLKHSWQKVRDEFAKAQRELAWARLKIEALEAERRKLLLGKYGPSDFAIRQLFIQLASHGPMQAPPLR